MTGAGNEFFQGLPESNPPHSLHLRHSPVAANIAFSLAENKDVLSYPGDLLQQWEETHTPC